MTVGKRRAKPRRHRATRFVGNERNVLARFHSQAGFHGVLRAGHEISNCWSEIRHGKYFNVIGDVLYWPVNTGAKVYLREICRGAECRGALQRVPSYSAIYARGVTRNAG